MSRSKQRWAWYFRVGLAIAILAVLGLVPAAYGAGETELAAPALQAVVKPLRVEPEKGYVGTRITLTSEGLPPARPVELVWATISGSYDTRVSSENVEFWDRTYTPRRASLGSAQTDSAGRLSTSVQVPEDYGEMHDLIAVVDGQDVAKGGFAVVRNATASPLDGPTGTPITIEVTGLGWTPFASTMAVLYDNAYVGFLSAVTTQGTARAQIRAPGPVGAHTIRLTDASGAVPYLNTEQSPRKLPQFKFEFNVTEDAGPPPATLDWPDDGRLVTNAALPRTTASAATATSGATARLEPSAGPILSNATVQAAGLPAGASLNLLWVSVIGNRVSGGWNLVQKPLGQATAGQDGTLATAIQVPEDLGGWHVVKLVQGEKVLAEAPYFVERSLVSVTPARVKAGEVYTVQVKGIGWTELDNGFAMLYDNAYVGYACGFNSQGDVTMNLVATGQPGTHLIDLYPMLYRVRDHGMGPWDYYLPQLTFAQDHPGLALGYRLPAFRLAITVVE
ncbi:MAG: hypothetical protein HY690_17810 [Chloroflexi bacterium]|nr:hypothetical protein [Chloroflexota bacterium]